MTNATLKAVAAAALIGLGTLALPATAEAGHGYHGHGHGGWGGGWGAGLVGFGVGAIVGSALAPREVYVAPPPGPGLLRTGVIRPSALEPGLVRLLPQSPRPVFQSEYRLLPGR